MKGEHVAVLLSGGRDSSLAALHDVGLMVERVGGRRGPE
jgi:predicted subunit of tRNA(5-methylaminomethyl-2-thiouridylate) methyltransferase